MQRDIQSAERKREKKKKRKKEKKEISPLRYYTLAKYVNFCCFCFCFFFFCEIFFHPLVPDWIWLLGRGCVKNFFFTEAGYGGRRGEGLGLKAGKKI